MKLHLWQQGSFVIKTNKGLALVDGFRFKHFGVHDKGNRRPSWTVTHLPSGLTVTPSGGGFSNLEMAKAFAERLETLGDWSHIDDNSPIRPLGEQAVAIWNELIALDVAKTMSDHYGNVPQHSLKVGRK